MKIEKMELIHLRMPLVRHFETSFGRVEEKETLIIRVVGEGISGYGECPAAAAPDYSYETVHTAWHVIRDFMAPRLRGAQVREPGPIADLFGAVRGHPMAKAGIEMAVNDMLARAQSVPLWKVLKGTRSEIPTGISLGIQDAPQDLLWRIEEALEKGYQRIKMKIKPGWDVDVLREVRRAYPTIQLMVDANAAYTPDDTEHLRKLDEFDLMMIEQPLDHGDLVDHAELQKKLRTPICLDESIKTYEDARRALDIGACRIINIKQARVGGTFAAKMVHNIARARGIPVWCGGMLETGIGRAHNIALATLPNFTLPGDISASERYYREDVIDPPVTVNTSGMIRVPEEPGMGYMVDEERLTGYAVRRKWVLP
ncbi:MAG: o-succinylbenzoate synthase [Planctomycetota bacterium]|jgi:O-succinylbenzoate synthase